MELRLDLRLSQKLVMTPQLQQAIKLLQLSRLELQQNLVQQLVENPLLEDSLLEAQEEESATGEEGSEPTKETEASADESEDSEESQPVKESEPLTSEEWDNILGNDWRPAQRDQIGAGDEEFPSYEQTLTKPASLEEHLEWQLRLSSLEGADRDIGRMIIGNLDEDGYLRVPLHELQEDAQCSCGQLEQVLEQIQNFDPPGVAAQNLEGCLLVQLRLLRQDEAGIEQTFPSAFSMEVVSSVIKNHLVDLQKKRYQVVAKALDVTLEEV
jgi:RNA polymerase sigma-54 factor